MFPDSAHAVVFAFLNDAEEFRLVLRAELGNLVEKQRSAERDEQGGGPAQQLARPTTRCLGRADLVSAATRRILSAQTRAAQHDGFRSLPGSGAQRAMRT